MKKRNIKIYSTVLFKVLLLVIFMFIVFTGISDFSAQNYKNQNQIIYDARTQKDKLIFSAVVAERSKPLGTLVNDYGIWDDMVNYIQNPERNKEFEIKYLDPYFLNTYSADSFKVYNTSGKLVYSVDNNPESTAQIEINDAAKLFSKVKQVHYFAKYKDFFIEVYGATVHPSDDQYRFKTKPKGFIFAIKIIDDELLNQIGNDTQTNAKIIDINETNKYDTVFKVETGHIAFKYDVYDKNNVTIAQYYVTDDVSAIKQSSLMQRRLIYINLTLYLIMAIIVLLLSYRWVFYPIRKINRALVKDDSKSIKALDDIKEQKNEFGRLAALVVEHKHQEDVIKLEKAQVENKVLDRTRQLQEEQARLKASIESLNLGFFMVNSNSEVIMINQKAKDLLSKVNTYEEKYANEWPLERIEKILKGAVPLGRQLDKCHQSQKIIELNNISFDHSVIKLFIAPILRLNEQHKQEYLGAITLIEDITEAKIMERSKDEFFSIASRELRTPLTAIRGNAKMIMDYYAQDIKDKDLKEMILDIHGSSVRLIEIVNDFLDMSSLEQGKMIFKSEFFNINDVIVEVAAEMDSVINEHRITLETDDAIKDLPKVYGDFARVKQVVYNLIGNAAKFTEKGGITVSGEYLEDEVKISVSDTGPGIPDDTKELLFHKFQQANQSILTRDVTRGTGLGLYISKLMVEKMGGQIKLENSKVGVGTTFSFTIPTLKQNDHSGLNKHVNVDTGLSSK